MEEEEWSSKWAELRGDGGLTSKHWRTRLTALHSLFAVADQSASMQGAPLTEILDLLLFSLALSDTHVLLRKTAVDSAKKFFGMIQNRLSNEELDQYLSGFLASSVDHEIEVQNAAAEALSSSFVLLGSHWFKEMIPRLVHKFVSTALHSMKLMERTSISTHFGGLRSSFDMGVMVPAFEGIIGVKQLFESASLPKTVDLDFDPHVALLLFAILASILEECEISRDRTGASKVSNLLRLFGSSKYRQQILFMISRQLYNGTTLARWDKISAFVGEELVGLLEKVDAIVILKGIYVALESGTIKPSAAFEGLKPADLEDVEAGVLRHIIENVQLPHDLVLELSETHNANSEKHYVNTSYEYMKIADAIIKDFPSVMLYSDIVEGMILICSVLASKDDKRLSWITIDMQELANCLVKRLGAIFSENSLPVQTLDVKTTASMGAEKLMLSVLPKLIPNLKGSLKDHLTQSNDVEIEGNSSITSLASAIIASHQLYWCLKQILHPNLSQLCTIIMPCALMALDHYSPDVKRQGMKLFIHLTEHLNPSELRWYKDAILDCVRRNFIGCGELWPLSVQTAIPLVLCIEGKNPRSKWYRNVLNEMLSELERHQLDAAYIKIWLESADQLLEAMGIVLVAHLKRLFSLLFMWLHKADDFSILLVLNLLKVIVTQTWLRVRFHFRRFWNELAVAYKESFDKKQGASIRSYIIDVTALVRMCDVFAFDEIWLDNGSDPDCLASALSQHLRGQMAKHQVL